MFQSQFHHMVEAISHDSEWKWAERVTDDLHLHKKKVDEAMTSWGRNLLCMEIRDFKARHDDQEFIAELSKFEGVVSEPLAAATRELRMLCRMHQGRKGA